MASPLERILEILARDLAFSKILKRTKEAIDTVERVANTSYNLSEIFMKNLLAPTRQSWRAELTQLMLTSVVAWI